MENTNLIIHSAVLIASTFISSASQIMLKKSAGRKYASRLAEYINPLVIFSYLTFFICTFITMYALKVVPLSMAPILESSGYIFVMVLSRFFLHETITKREIFGAVLIIVGILVYSY